MDPRASFLSFKNENFENVILSTLNLRRNGRPLYLLRPLIATAMLIAAAILIAPAVVYIVIRVGLYPYMRSDQTRMDGSNGWKEQGNESGFSVETWKGLEFAFEFSEIFKLGLMCCDVFEKDVFRDATNITCQLFVWRSLFSFMQKISKNPQSVFH